MKAFIVDGNYYLHRAFNVSASNRKIEHVEKNTLDLFLKFVCNDALFLKATHVLVCFDSKRSWRHDLYADYKATRNKGGAEITTSDGATIKLEITAGSLVKRAKMICELAGLPVAQKKGYEGDDLLGSAAETLPCKCVIGTRDKDAFQLATEDGRVVLWWPSEKQIVGWKDVIKKFKVKPTQIAEYLALMGDTSDNIPGIDGVGPGTAATWLSTHGTLAKAVKADPKIKKRMAPHKQMWVLCKTLTTVRRDVTFKLEDLVPQPLDHDLQQHVWQIPASLKELSDARKYASKKGLFGR